MEQAKQYQPYFEEVTPVAVPRPRVSDRTIVIPQTKEDVKYIRLGVIASIVLTILATITILTSMIVANKSRQLAELNAQTNAIQQENVMLTQQVQELSQYDRVMKIAEQYGLRVYEGNVTGVE